MASTSLYTEALEKFRRDVLQKNSDYDTRILLNEFLKEGKSSFATPGAAKLEAKQLQAAAGDKYGGSKYFPESWIRNILGNMDKITEVGSSLLNKAPESVGMAWFAVSLTLKAISNNYALYTLFGTGLTDITEVMIVIVHYDRLYDGRQKSGFKTNDMVEKLFRDTSDAYAAVLDFAFAVKKHMSGGTLDKLKHGFKDFFGTQKPKFEGKLQVINVLKAKVLESSTGVFQEKTMQQFGDTQLAIETLRQQQSQVLELGQEQREMMNKLLERFVEAENSLIPKTPWELVEDEFKAIRKRLNPLDDPYPQLDRLLANKYENTCKWVFVDQKYQSWSKFDQNAILCLVGGPGSGKSTVLATLVQRLGPVMNAQGPFINYVSCSENRGSQNSSLEGQTLNRVYCTLLCQIYELAAQNDEEVSLLATCNRILRDPKRQKVGNLSRQTAQVDGFIDFASDMAKLVAALQQDTILIIDAIGNLSSQDQDELYESLQTLVNNTQTKKLISVLVASRQETLFIQRHPCINLNNANRTDLEIVLDSELNTLPGWSASERQLARQKILEKAGYSFSYIQNIAIPFLEQPFQRPVSNYLKALPEGMNEGFDQAISSMPQNYYELLELSVTWCLLAPSTVTVKEVLEAYSGVYTMKDDGDDLGTAIDDTYDEFATDLEVQQIIKASGPFLVTEKHRNGHTLVKLQDAKQVRNFVDRPPEAQQHPNNFQTCNNCKYCDNCKAIAIKQAPLAIDDKIAHYQIALILLKHLNNSLFQHRFGLHDKPVANGESLASREDIGSGQHSPVPAHDQEKIAKSEDTLAEPAKPVKPADPTELAELSEMIFREFERIAQRIQTLPTEDDLMRPTIVSLFEEASQLIDGLGTAEDTAVSKIDETLKLISQLLDATDEMRNADVVEVSAKFAERSEKKAPDYFYDNQSVDGEFAGYNLSTYLEEDEATVPSPSSDNDTPHLRYEINNWPYHLQQAEKLWPADQRQNNKTWTHWNDDIQKELTKLVKNAEVFDQWWEMWRQNHSVSYTAGPVMPLHVAACLGLSTWVENLLANGADIHDLWGGENVLQASGKLAGSHQNVGLLRLFLEKSVDPCHAEYGDSPGLHLWLSNCNNLQTVQAFVDHGVDFNSTDQNGWTALHTCAWYCNDVRSFHLIMNPTDTSKIPNINAEDDKNETPLHKLLWRGDTPLDLLKAFLAVKGIIVNCDDKDSQQPLAVASSWGYVDIVKLLLEANADVKDTDDSFTRTALHQAAIRGHVGCVQALLDYRSSVRMRDKWGSTPLHYAAYHGRGAAVELLLSYGSDVNAANNRDRTPFFEATRSSLGTAEAAQIILTELKRRGYSAIEINQFTTGRRTPLRQAALRGFTDVVKELLTYIADSDDADAKATINEGGGFSNRTALHCAAIRGNPDCVQLLLDHGADAIQADDDGKTPLELALEQWSQRGEHSFESVILKLIDGDQQTAIANVELPSIAAASGSVVVLQKLHDLHADLERTDGEGWTPLAHARQAGHEEVINFLKRIASTGKAVPSKWVDHASLNALDKTGQKVSYTMIMEQDSMINCLVSNKPLPASIEQFYFEITVEDLGDESVLAIGFCTLGVKAHTFPGWRPRSGFSSAESWAYHADNGQLYHSKLSDGIACEGGPYGTGDTVGCGVNLETRKIWFTKNGKQIAEGFDGVRGRLYPMLGLFSSVELQTNFGQKPFKWKNP